MREIGSEFMMDSYKKGINEYISLIEIPKRYVLSGRTGLYLIAEELKNQGVISISLPAYCCGSMVTPFYDAGFIISFYEEDIPANGAVLVMDYFGYLSEKTFEFTKKCKEARLKIVVDATQTAFSKSRTYDFADYIVVSYRKWFDCLCAAVYSRNGFQMPDYVKEKDEYVTTWREAAQKKRCYIETGIGNKQEFLDLYSEANNMLAVDYPGYKASESEIERFENADSMFIREARRSNAMVLMNMLIGKLDLMFGEIGKEDCPLHVPILKPNHKRTHLSKELTKKAIYCPFHWPLDAAYPGLRTRFHDEEMSLICDQRYTVTDMVEEAEEILRIINREKR